MSSVASVTSSGIVHGAYVHSCHGGCAKLIRFPQPVEFRVNLATGPSFFLRLRVTGGDHGLDSYTLRTILQNAPGLLTWISDRNGGSTFRFPESVSRAETKSFLISACLQGEHVDQVPVSESKF